MTQETRERTIERLVDGLWEMIESNRLNEADIPDDFQWLTEMLNRLSPTKAKPTDGQGSFSDERVV